MIAILKQVFNFKILFKIAFLLSLIGFIVLISDFGYNQSNATQQLINGYYFIVLTMGVLVTAIRYITLKKNIHDKVFIFDIISSLLIVYIVLIHFFRRKHIASCHFYTMTIGWNLPFF